MADTFNKKEREKKRDKRKQDKLQKKEARKDSSGGSWESMLMYVDEFGRLTEMPPDGTKKEVSADDIEIGVPKRSDEPVDNTLSGVIYHFDDKKGYGFIKTDSDDNFFFHQNNISGVPQRGKKVTFEKERGAKGWAAVNIKFI